MKKQKRGIPVLFLELTALIIALLILIVLIVAIIISFQVKDKDNGGETKIRFSHAEILDACELCHVREFSRSPAVVASHRGCRLTLPSAR